MPKTRKGGQMKGKEREGRLRTETRRKNGGQTKRQKKRLLSDQIRVTAAAQTSGFVEWDVNYDLPAGLILPGVSTFFLFPPSFCFCRQQPPPGIFKVSQIKTTITDLIDWLVVTKCQNLHLPAVECHINKIYVFCIKSLLQFTSTWFSKTYLLFQQTHTGLSEKLMTTDKCSPLSHLSRATQSGGHYSWMFQISNK